MTTEGHLLAFLRIPFDVLIALDNRTLHFYLQPVHYLIRLAHVLAASAFFGGIGLLDMRLMGWRGSVMLRPYAEHVLPILYATFGVAAVTGVTLFAYDPVHVGSHAFFVPKLLLLVFGVINALLYHQTGYVAALASERHLPTSARVAGALSLALWTGVVVCASLNVEDAPKVFLR